MENNYQPSPEEIKKAEEIMEERQVEIDKNLMKLGEKMAEEIDEELIKILEENHGWVDPDDAERFGLVRTVEDIEPVPHDYYTKPSGDIYECAGCVKPHNDGDHYTVHYGQSVWVIEVTRGWSPHLDYTDGVYVYANNKKIVDILNKKNPQNKSLKDF